MSEQGQAPGRARRRRRTALVGGLIAVLAALIAAGVVVAVAVSTSAVPADPGSGSTAHTVTPDEQSSPGVPVDDISRDDLVDEHVASWSGYEVVSDHELRFTFHSGTPDCYGTRVQVTETAQTIEVTIYVGTLPHLGNTACIEIGRIATVLVTTTDPIGDRAIVAPDVASS